MYAARIKTMTSNLPLIRLSAVNPFLLELRRRGIDTQALLVELNLPTDVPASNDLFVEPLTIYTLVERCAELADDRFFGYSIGSQLQLLAWPPIITAAENARSVGDLLSMFAVNATEHSTASVFSITTDGERSTFRLRRVKIPPFQPGQNDAFYTGMMLNLLRRAADKNWDARLVMLNVADPACIPPGNEAYRIAKGDNSGITATFPSPWLFESFEVARFKTGIDDEVPSEIPQSLVESVRSALTPHLHKTDLSVDKAARICGHDRRKLARKLRDAGTTMSREIARLRSRKARQELEQSSRRIADIGASVGFTDPTVFSRAFKKWTGQSPQEYRRSHKSPD